MTKEQIRTYLIDEALNKIVGYIMEDEHCSMLTAMQQLYASPVTAWLQNEDDDLYVQSPAYIYEMMKRKASTASTSRSRGPKGESALKSV